DLAIAFAGFNLIGIYNNVGGAFVPDRILPVGLTPLDMKVVDINFDGLPDLVTANILSNDVSVLKNLGLRTFSAAVNVPTALRPIRIVSTQSDNALGVDL